MKFFSRKKARKVDVIMSMEDRNKLSDEFARRAAEQFLPSTNEFVDFSSQIPHKNTSQLIFENTLLTTQPIGERKESSIQESYGTVEGTLNVAQSTAINTSLQKEEKANVCIGLLIASVFVTVLTVFGALASLLFNVLSSINVTVLAIILLATTRGIYIFF